MGNFGSDKCWIGPGEESQWVGVVSYFFATGTNCNISYCGVGEGEEVGGALRGFHVLYDRSAIRLGAGGFGTGFSKIVNSVEGHEVGVVGFVRAANAVVERGSRNEDDVVGFE